VRIRLYRVVAFVGVLGASAVSPASAQIVTDGRVWASISLQERSNTSSAWRWGADAFVRTRDGVGGVDSSAGRFMIGYDVTSRSSLWAGYNAGGVFPSSGGVTVEQRVFQQHVWTAPAGSGGVSLRLRLEQRFIEGNSGAAWRLREQVRFSRPIAGGGRFALVVWDEIFLHLNETSRLDRGLDQNRVFAGLSRAVAGVRLEVGYLNQFSHSRAGPNRVNHVLSSGASMTF
jgi:hypothetical protein